jgi:hypothetical protein
VNDQPAVEYYEAPNHCPHIDDRNKANVFLAGGITGCPPWQAEAVEMFRQIGYPVRLFNPARENFPIGDPSAGRQQVEWEQCHLLHPDTVTLLWFPASGPVVQPIALLEFGQILGQRHQRAIDRPGKVVRPFVVGADFDYARRADVRLFLQLHEPEIPLHDNLRAVVEHATILTHRS